MSNSDILRILSPLMFFFFHVLYLVVFSDEPFLNKWIDGSFTFFVALVLCNIIRARLVAGFDQSGPPDDADNSKKGPESDRTP